MTTKEVSNRVRSLFWGHNHKFFNTFIHAWEADHFSVTSTGYSYEVEVKVSRSDFFADFKKPKHQLIGNIFNKCHPGSVGYRNCPNRFFFACPVGLIEAHEVPKYAGLIYVIDALDTRIIKKAPLLHTIAFDPKEMLFHKYLYMIDDLRQEIREKDSSIKILKSKLDAITSPALLPQQSPMELPHIQF